MTQSNDKRGRIRQRIITLCGIGQVGDDDDIFAMGLLNSLYALRLVQAIEQEFDFSVPDDELKVANFRSVRDIEGMVARVSLAG
jgi:methoxymalonate biosynthesis acyl carrier protein